MAGMNPDTRDQIRFPNWTGPREKGSTNIKTAPASYRIVAPEIALIGRLMHFYSILIIFTKMTLIIFIKQQNLTYD